MLPQDVPVKAFTPPTYGSTAAAAAAAAALVQRPNTAPGQLFSARTAWRPPAHGTPAHAVVEKIQAYVFPRRVRVKERFMDFDPLHSGRCTESQFSRVVNAIAPETTEQEVATLVEYFSQEGASFPQVVNYKNFVRTLDEVFMVAELEKTPTLPVPRPGTTLGASLQRDPVSPPPPEPSLDEEEYFAQLLQDIAQMVKTRGIVLRSCFQDCERSDATSLMTPRYSGKVTTAQFQRHFPFVNDISEYDLELLITRYSTNAGSVHYLAFDRDVENVELPSSAGTPRPPTGMTDRTFTSQRVRPKREVTGPSALEKVKAIAGERRLRIADKFRDFDRLRRGVCHPAHVNTVFTIVRLELDAGELEALKAMYADERGMFRHKDFVRDLPQPFSKLEAGSPSAPSSAAAATPRLAMMTPGATATPSSARGRPTPESRSCCRPDLEAGLQELEASIRKHVQQRSLPMKRAFGDFDHARSGRVTRSQFERILSMLGIELNATEADLLAEAYADPEKPWAFRYFDFCAAVDIRADWDMGAYPPPKSKYFTRSGVAGKVVPLQSRFGGAGAMVAGRPCTR